MRHLHSFPTRRSSDLWSMGVFFRELSALYAAYREGRESPLPELGVQYADYAVWQREQLAGEVLDRQLSYWRERDRKSTRLNYSHLVISYAVFCLKKKK